ncbi:hypothetical protein PILCRDRAFT_821473 [Piloderma croceum F 1598]|uniref:Uncharacterized protein n=1 Tax=Piloderma croceum (strain F 1598) TaxID=765440 RepID=A0A0C3B565_PILCF|nr:hypothetical protein PILCRDRAFT_821473 [Piloderma croceum F 1598]
MVRQEQPQPSVLSRLERQPPRFSRIAHPQATQTLHSAPYVEDVMTHPPIDLSEASGYDNLEEASAELDLNDRVFGGDQEGRTMRLMVSILVVRLVRVGRRTLRRLYVTSQRKAVNVNVAV